MNASQAQLEVTPRQALASLQDGLGLSEDDLAGGLGTTVRTLQRWKANLAYPQQAARQRLASLLQLLDHAIETFGSGEAVQQWTQSESRLLSGITPAEAIRAGRWDRADAALEAFDSGIFL